MVNETYHLVLCRIIGKPEMKGKNKIRFTSNVKLKKVLEASIICMINGEMFKKNIQIRDLGASCRITIDDIGLYDVTNINESVQGSSGSMTATKKVNCI